MGAAMQLVMPFSASPSYHAADFIRGESNAEALRWVESWPNWPYSIILLHGPKGSGKTHLSHVFAVRAHATMIDVARVGSLPADHLLTGNHCWVLDNMDAATDAPALAQLINHVRARGDYLLMTATDAASQLLFALPDLRSRLLALPSAALGAPDDALLVGVLAKEFADRQLRIAPDVVHYAATYLERSYAAMQQFANAVDALSLARGRAITLPLVRELLKVQDK
jgi:chromosomal replication initiation ATPase DnaA